MTASRALHPDDMHEIARLVNRCALGGEGTTEDVSPQALSDQISYPRIDRERDLRVWERAGEIAAFARLTIEPVGDELQGRLYYSIRTHGDAALEREIVGWASGRMLEVAGKRPVRIVHAISVRDPERSARLQALGFSVHRRYLDMIRSLAEPIAEPALPPGHTLRPCRGAEDAARYVELFNESFVDTRDFAPLIVADFLHDIQSPGYRADRDPVIESPDGLLVGFCFFEVDEGTPHLGMINSIGVRRGCRRRGLGEVLLLSALRRLQGDGVAEVHLRVDADSRTGATRLYARAGFSLRYVETRLALDEQEIRALAGGTP